MRIMMLVYSPSVFHFNLFTGNSTFPPRANSLADMISNVNRSCIFSDMRMSYVCTCA